MRSTATTASHLTLRPSQVQRFLRRRLTAGGRALLVGAPGLGKTAIVHAAAGAIAAERGVTLYTWGDGYQSAPPDLAGCGVLLVLARPAVEDPVDASGLPHRVDSAVGEVCRHVPMERVAVARAAHAAGWIVIWYDDDLGQATEAVQASRMALLDVLLPRGVAYVAASNRRMDRAGSRGLIEPVKSRVSPIVEMTAHLGDWSDWAVTAPWVDHGYGVLAFLQQQPDALHEPAPTADLVNSPSPRTWEQAGELVAECHDPDVLPTVLAGTVGHARAIELVAYLQIQAEVDVSSILMDPAHAPLPPMDQPSRAYLAASGLAMRAAPNTIAAVEVYLHRLYDAGFGACAGFSLAAIQRRAPACRATPAWTKACVTWASALMIGEGVSA